jgi:dihydroorotate dehydrogenase electron transfer subunit
MREIIVTVLENKRIAEEIYSLTFCTEEEISVRAGQFCMIGVGAHPLRRPIAICKAEGERITVCYRLKGEGTRSLASDYKAGEKLSVLLPLGNGFSLTPAQKKIAVVGGGVGIFPLISAIREFAGQKEIYAYMGFRNKDAVCMEYDMLRADRLVVATDDGSAGVCGTSVQAFVNEYETVKPDAVLACGPTPMLRALKEAMQGKGIPVYVSLEERMGCGIGACLVCTCKTKEGGRARVCKDGPVFEMNEVEI